jgi:ABC-type antimicrobial peptide transport system permease subunit
MAAWTVIGRLKPGATLVEARANIEALFAASKADATRMFRGAEPVVKSLQWRWVQYSRLLLLVMAAAAGCFLLIACANVANLLLARFSTRSHELAVRAAIGAGRARLVRQLLTEVALLTGIGCALGMAIVATTLRWFVHFAGDAIPRLHAVHVDGRVFAIALLVSVVTATRAMKVDPMAALRHE